MTERTNKFILDKISKNLFWNATQYDFDSFNAYLKKYRDNVNYYLYWASRPGRYILTFKYVNDKYISCNMDDCVIFTISKDKYTEISLDVLTTKCKIIGIKTRELMTVMDHSDHFLLNFIQNSRTF